ncbi:histidine ammonia-lyase [Scopulibacillus darangshiensis]|uniref:Histidine ammonia-lyase n=1 Tax=Scopulibacillus darangshiensis TaxID=442528 RepID=A0A4R2NJJ9_9BACL|nr:histidine ammonia-lyase [Scopulibacillus darangshiensis]TCP21304.1 histidine ammonia-lyase [Scopulibacillus darangshiensis]
MNSTETRHPKDIKDVLLKSHSVSMNDFIAVARYGAKVSFSQDYCDRVNHSRHLVEKCLEENRLIYGITTGFGDNVTQVISPKDAERLQRNIVRSHAVSVGDSLEKEVVRATQLMMLISLGQGYSGVRLDVLQLIASLLNHDVMPFVPGDGSVGYLGPEAHMALVLMGEGLVLDQGELIPGKEALKKAGLEPVTLGCKEGLALTSGTTSVMAHALLALYNGIQSAKTADIAGAMSLEALKGTLKAFDPRYHSVKRHKEQAGTAENILRILDGSDITEKYKDFRLQDAHSLRCIPQMHGAAKKALKDALDTIMDEMGSTGDNPIIYPEGDDGIGLMGGNFDGSYVGIYSDAMCIAMANLAKISERRGDRLVNQHFSGLPNFLTANPGLNNGYMIPQYTAAGLLGEIKVLSHPATVDSVSTSAGQEDPVTFAYLASKKAYTISKKLEYILAIELMAAAQALDFHGTLQPSLASKAAYNLIRSRVPIVEEDRYFYPDIESIKEQIHEGDILRAVENVVGELQF